MAKKHIINTWKFGHASVKMELKAHLHYGKNRAKLVRLRENNSFTLLKHSNLVQFSP